MEIVSLNLMVRLRTFVSCLSIRHGDAWRIAFAISSKDDAQPILGTPHQNFAAIPL